MNDYSNLANGLTSLARMDMDFVSGNINRILNSRKGALDSLDPANDAKQMGRLTNQVMGTAGRFGDKSASMLRGLGYSGQVQQAARLQSANTARSSLNQRMIDLDRTKAQRYAELAQMLTRLPLMGAALDATGTANGIANNARAFELWYSQAKPPSLEDNAVLYLAQLLPHFLGRKLL